MSTKLVKVGIIQLTRIGDLIQTAQAARQFKAENPGVELTLIARRKFANGLTFLLETVFDDIVMFDTIDFFQKKSFKDANIRVHNLIHDLNKKKFDLVYNFSFCKSSSYLNALIKTQVRSGIYRNIKNEVSINDKWSQFVYSNVMNSPHNPFSLVDIYRYIMGVQQTLVLDPDENFEARDNNIVIHPFASQKKKRWGANKWNELIFKLAKENPEYQFHIVGGPDDILESNRLMNSPALEAVKDRIHCHAGKKSIAQTYQLLINSKLFIGHDSMVGHLASETVTPSLIVSLGTVRPSETTPYSSQVINIAPKNKCYPCNVSDSCELLPCHNSINHQLVSTVARQILNGELVNREFLVKNVAPFHLDPVKVYTSSYDDNGICLTEITDNDMSAKDVFKDFYKVIWQYYLRETEIAAGLPRISRETASTLSSYVTGTSYLFELYNFGVKYCNHIINEAEATQPNLAIIQDNISKLGEIDQLCSLTKQTYPFLTNLIDYFYVNKANAMGDNIIEISKSNLLNYYDASNLTAVLNDFVEKSIGPHVTINEVNKEV